MPDATDDYQYLVYTDKPNQIYDDENVDLGWEISSTQIFSETVTTVESGGMGNMATLAYAGNPTTLGTLTITINGTSYTCEQLSDNEQYLWGASNPSDFSEYPFVLLYYNGAWYLITETAGEYTIAASESIATTTANFDMAAQTAVGGMAPLRIILGTTTWQEVYDAMAVGRVAVASALDNDFFHFLALSISSLNSHNVYCVACTDGDAISMITLSAASADGALEAEEW